MKLTINNAPILVGAVLLAGLWAAVTILGRLPHGGATAQTQSTPVPASNGVSNASLASANATPAPAGTPQPRLNEAEGAIAISKEGTFFYASTDFGAAKTLIPSGLELHLQFESNQPGKNGWYGVEVMGVRGYVWLDQINMPAGIYTQSNLRELLPWGEWPPK